MIDKLEKYLETAKDGDPIPDWVGNLTEAMHEIVGSPFIGETKTVESAKKVLKLYKEKYD